jgi:carbon starvation protein
LEAAERMLFNDRLNAVVALIFMAVVILVIAAAMREWLLVLSRRKPAVMHEAPFVPTRLGIAGD